jgi:hypothetical protein
MKRTHRSVLALLLAAAVLPACDKTAVQDITAPPAGSARIKFANFGNGSPGVNFYANDTKMTAISATSCTPPTNPACTQAGLESTTGVIFGNHAAGGFYMAIAPGQHTLTGRIAAATDKDLPISSLPVTVGDGKFYTFYQSGVYNTTTKSIDSFIVEDVFPANFDYTVAYVRFVNAIHNSEPMTLSARLIATGAEGAIGGPVAYKAGGQFIGIPGGVYTLTARYANGTTALTRADVSFVAGRVYTIAARGTIGTTASLLLDNTANR